MDISWFVVAIFLGLIIVWQEIVIIKRGNKIKTLEHYIDMYKNKTERDILENKK